MGIFGFGNKNRVIDWTEKAPRTKQTESAEEYLQSSQDNTPPQETSTVPTAFGFFGNTPQPTTPTSTENNEQPDQRKKLAKRLIDMTSKIEDLSNQIYHLQQRLEVIERKNDINRF